MQCREHKSKPAITGCMWKYAIARDAAHKDSLFLGFIWKQVGVCPLLFVQALIEETEGER